MDITCISDLHGYFPSDLPGGDLLIVAGDLTARDTPLEHINFYEWLREQPYSKKIMIAGNHDNFIQNLKSKYFPPTVYYSNCEYLCDSGTEFEGLKIWGSPWVKSFPGMNPKCMAFTVDTDGELAEKWDKIPADTDILITHSPPYGILDYIEGQGSVGSGSLLTRSSNIKPKIHIFGHIHECYGQLKTKTLDLPHFINASHVNEHYKPVNKPVRIVL